MKDLAKMKSAVWIVAAGLVYTALVCQGRLPPRWGQGIMTVVLVGSALMACTEIVAMMAHCGEAPFRSWLAVAGEFALAVAVSWWLLCVPVNLRLLILTGVACCGTDCMCWICGTCLPRVHKVRGLARISPNKTWEGYALGYSSGLLAVLVTAEFVWPGYRSSDRWLLGYLAVVCALALLGDLMGSLVKRGFGVKDSGEIMLDWPGWLGALERLVRDHGGYLDRMDSLLPGLMCMILWTKPWL